MKALLKNFYRALCGLLILAVAVSLVGCASDSGENSSGVPAEPKVVRINTTADPDSLDPWRSAASDTEAIFHNVFEGLCLYDSAGNIIPGLAESWEISEDGKTYTFHLRKDVTFHNGKKFTSADVLYSYNQLTGLSGGEPLTKKFSMVESIEAPDEATFVAHLSAPSAAFLSLTVMAVLPEGYEEQAVTPVGTGPFRFVEYTPSQRIVLEKNEDYYDKGEGDAPGRMAQVDRVEVYIMDDSAAVVSALRSGQLDIAAILDAEDAKVLEGEFDIYNSPQNMVQSLFLNHEVAPFDDARVRKAVSYAVNRQEIVDGVFGGYATALPSNFSPVMAAYYNSDLEGTYEYNVEQAKALLKEAGLENGFFMTITVPANYQKHIDTAQVIAQQLSAVGIDAKIELIEWASWLEDVYKNANYQSTIVGLSGKLDPDSVLGRYESTYASNFFHFANEEYDELITAARVELDQEKRAEEYKRCQEILTEEAAAVYLTDPNLIVACRKDLKGFTFYPVTFYDFSTLRYE